jgi:hypothetical protein
MPAAFVPETLSDGRDGAQQELIEFPSDTVGLFR